MAATARRRQFTADEYHKMLAAGILDEDDAVELIGGDLVTKAPKSTRHAACLSKLNELLSGALRRRATIRVQDPITLGTLSEPEPDIVLAKHRVDAYAKGHPTAGDILLVIEVADSSLLYDREVKIPLYASFGIPEVWLVALTRQAVTVFTEPRAKGYDNCVDQQPGDTLQPTAFPEVQLPVAALLP